MERLLSCAGFCTYSWFYVFTDVTRGVPVNTCFDAAIALLKDNLLIILIAGAGLAFSQLLGLIGSFLICCSPNSEPFGTGCVDSAAIAKLFAPTGKKALKAQIETPMLVVIPQAQ